MTTDFNFYLNTQGIRGKKGDKGDPGFAPVITVGQNTLNTFTLLITTIDGTFETENLRGSVISGAGTGTFLAYNRSTDSLYLTDLPTATPEDAGIVRLASEEEISELSGDGVVTVSDLSDLIGANLYDYLVAGDNIQLSLDSETGRVTISASLDNVPVATTTSLGVVQPDGTSILVDGNGVISAVAAHDDHDQVVQNTSDIAELQGNKEDKFVTRSPLYKETAQHGTVRGFSFSSETNTVTTDGVKSHVAGTYTNFDAILAGARGIFSNYNLGDIVRVPRDWGVAFGRTNADNTFDVIVAFSEQTSNIVIATPNGKNTDIGRVSMDTLNQYRYGSSPIPNYGANFASGLDISSVSDYYIAQLTPYIDNNTLRLVCSGAYTQLSTSYNVKGSKYWDTSTQDFVYNLGDINTVVFYPSDNSTSSTVNGSLFRQVRINDGTSVVGSNITFNDIENATNLINLGSSYTTRSLAISTATTSTLGVVQPDGTTITISNGVISADLSGLATVATTGDYNDLTNKPTIPTVGDGTITITQGGTTKGTFTVNQAGDTTIALDAGGGTGNIADVTINGTSIVDSSDDTAKIPVATTSALGVVQPDGTTITINNGVISSVGGTGAVSSVNGQTGAVVLTASDVNALPSSTVIPTVNDVTITFTQGGVTKGSFTTNQSSGATIALDAGGSGSAIEVYYE